MRKFKKVVKLFKTPPQTFMDFAEMGEAIKASAHLFPEEHNTGEAVFIAGSFKVKCRAYREAVLNLGDRMEKGIAKLKVAVGAEARKTTIKPYPGYTKKQLTVVYCE